MLPLVVQLRHPLLVTTVIALGVGHIEEFGPELSASRTLVHFPLFHLGWRIGQGFLSSWFTRPTYHRRRSPRALRGPPRWAPGHVRLRPRNGPAPLPHALLHRRAPVVRVDLGTVPRG
ncbi:hypothetical protein CG719_09290 [Streptomyces sp. CB01373]|nr:hypothetical protein CG719_09290 [Streptomyces sp. CB01373]